MSLRRCWKTPLASVDGTSKNLQAPRNNKNIPPARGNQMGKKGFSATPCSWCRQSFTIKKTLTETHLWCLVTLEKQTHKNDLWSQKIQAFNFHWDFFGETSFSMQFFWVSTTHYSSDRQTRPPTPHHADVNLTTKELPVRESLYSDLEIRVWNLFGGMAIITMFFSEGSRVPYGKFLYTQI